ncbi:MAG: glycosyltransferase family 2 protein [Candidatus Cryosericum sp.]
MSLATLILIVASAFWLMIIYHIMLTVAGLIHRAQPVAPPSAGPYPGVDILIPARNEAGVLFDTLDAMSKLQYPGKLEIYILNDNSSDNTAQIAQYYADRLSNIHYVEVPAGSPKGKARVLNYGLSISTEDLVAVYDADNQPEPDAIKLLVDKTLENDRYAGAVGTVRTINMHKNALTRMIGLEFMVFQLLMQSGRWLLFHLGTYTGTNMLVRRSVLKEIGGWDEHALAEDTELSMRIISWGLLIPVVPTSITQEQEPETLGVWIRQRSRWLQGNLYTISKLTRDSSLRHGQNLVNIIQMLTIYYGFMLLLLISDIWFVLGLLGLLQIHFTVPLLVLWFETVWIYAAQIVAATVSEKQASFLNILFGILMYFTYSQLWVYLVIKEYVVQLSGVVRKAEPVWEKTPRF